MFRQTAEQLVGEDSILYKSFITIIFIIPTRIKRHGVGTILVTDSVKHRATATVLRSDINIVSLFTSHKKNLFFSTSYH